MSTRTVGYGPSPMRRQRYRLRSPSGREIILEAEPGEIYIDRETGEPFEVVGEVLPLPPNKSNLPWAVEYLRFCDWCDQLAPIDLNDCPTCGRRMGPLDRPPALPPLPGARSAARGPRRLKPRVRPRPQLASRPS